MTQHHSKRKSKVKKDAGKLTYKAAGVIRCAG